MKAWRFVTKSKKKIVNKIIPCNGATTVLHEGPPPRKAISPINAPGRTRETSTSKRFFFFFFKKKISKWKQNKKKKKKILLVWFPTLLWTSSRPCNKTCNPLNGSPSWTNTCPGASSLSWAPAAYHWKNGIKIIKTKNKSLKPKQTNKAQSPADNKCASM